MGYPDISDPDGRTDGAARHSRAARPAWDAATYGVPEDLRLARGRGESAYPDAPGADQPPYLAGGATDYGYGGDGYAGGGSFAGDSFAGDSFAGGRSSADGFATPSDSYVAAPPHPPSFAADSYEFDPFAGEREDGYAYQWDGEPERGYPGGTDPGPGAAPAGAGRRPDAGRSADSAAYPGGEYAGTDPAPDARAGSDPGSGTSQGPGSGRPPRRAGRNLPAAIGIGVLLGGVVLASLFIWRPAFLGVVAIAVGIGIWELVRAIRTSGVNPPLIPLVIGGVLMTGLGWWGQADALTFGLIVTVLAAMVWRLADGAFGYGRDVTGATLVAVYLPFLAGFAALLASPTDGGLRVLVMLACVVLTDTGGYIAGVLFGRHPMAPAVSPKKSWEGLAGSLVAAGGGGALLLALIFDVSPLAGIGFGLAVAVAAVLGDLAESLVKRDLGVKDMSNLLPGHGGLMDRLDSILFAAPTAYALLTLLAPAS